MRQLRAAPFALFAFGLAACATSPVATAPSPVPTAPVTTAPREAPRDWQLLDPATDSVPGTGSERAMRELLAGAHPGRTVVVAVIDGGVDTLHFDLRANLWSNPREVAGNGKDDDGNGYVDDVRGWNFIGGADGKNVHFDTFEVTRLFARCAIADSASKRGGGGTGDPTGDAPQRCAEIDSAFTKQRDQLQDQYATVKQIADVYEVALPLLRTAAGSDSLTTEKVSAISSTNPRVREAQRLYLDLAAHGITPHMVTEAKEEIEARLQYGLNPAYDPRPIVGDEYANAAERLYGNRDVMGPDAKHGTHVSGIIGAARENQVGIEGIAPAVQIMAVRTVPDGDERDKDVANAIRYAVDNGAAIINMSFGKGFSPQKRVVDDAVKYADSKGVLMIHAAGNDGENTDLKANYPTPEFLDGGRAQNWIEVGASSWKGGDSLVASFSNFGRTAVDVFAPGEDIYSTIPGNLYERDSGTSMAAPVVSGVAALIMAYYPTLSASDVKRIILTTATSYADRQVIRPGSNEKVSFGTLSATGGIVNAYAALKMAAEIAGKGTR